VKGGGDFWGGPFFSEGFRGGVDLIFWSLKGWGGPLSRGVGWTFFSGEKCTKHHTPPSPICNEQDRLKECPQLILRGWGLFPMSRFKLPVNFGGQRHHKILAPRVFPFH